jgi:hypothetical protein
MKWEKDLVKDIRSNTYADNVDAGIQDFVNFWSEVKDDDNCFKPYPEGTEVSDCNRNALLEQFLKIKDECKSILEIGIGRNGDRSFATIFSQNKKNETIYIGIDIEDRSWLVDCGENIYTIQGDSSNYDQNIEIIKEQFNVTEFDFIFIDGLHSVNQVLKDWEYTNLLSDNGIVGLHDTRYHTGPYLFIRNLDKKVWNVIENACPNDYGIGFATKKSS